MLRTELPPLVFSDAAAITKVKAALLKCIELAESIDSIIDASSCSKGEKTKMHMATAMLKLTCLDTIVNVFNSNDVSVKQRAIVPIYLQESDALLRGITKLFPVDFGVPTIPIHPGLHICRDISVAREILFLLNKIERRAGASVASVRKTKSLRRQLKAYYVPVGEIMHLCAGFKVCLFLDHDELIPDAGWRHSTEDHREFNAKMNKDKFFP